MGCFLVVGLGAFSGLGGYRGLQREFQEGDLEKMRETTQ